MSDSIINVKTEDLKVAPEVYVALRGLTGNGISSVTLNPDYTLTINFTDGDSYTTSSIRGAVGAKGDTGDTGNGIESIEMNADYTLTITMTDGTIYTTESIRGAQGDKGDTGVSITNIEKTSTSGLVDTYTISLSDSTEISYDVTNGNGITSVEKTSTSGLVDTYTITFDDGSTETFTVTNGEKGDTGDTGNGITSITKTGSAVVDGRTVDTYTVTYTDSTTMTFTVTNGKDGEVQDVQIDGTSVVTDGVADIPIADILEDYAKVDGYYQDMSVGDAEQLVSTIFEEDSTPYLFRTSGGSIDIGDREYDKIVGGTIAWNQRIKNGDFSNGTTNWGKGASADTFAVADGVATLTLGSKPTNYFGHNIQQSGLNLGDATGHKVFICASVKSSRGGSLCIAMPNSTSASTLSKEVTQNAWASIANIVNLSSGSHPIQISTGYNYADNEIGDTISAKYVNCFDLTQMFGSTVADYIYSLEQATAGAGVAFFRKLFPKPYYAYNAGELLSVSGLQSHDTVGFNAWDEEWEVGDISYVNGQNENTNDRIRSKNYITVIPNTQYFCSKVGASGVYAIFYYDADKAYLGHYPDLGTSQGVFTTPTNCAYIRFRTYIAYGTTYNHDICINLSWDGERDGEYEEYVKHSYALDDSLTLRGIPKLDVNNKLYYDGDTYEADGTVTRRYKEWSPTTATVSKDTYYSNLTGVACFYFGMPSDAKGYNAWVTCPAIADKLEVLPYSLSVRNCIFNNSSKMAFMYCSSSADTTVEQAQEVVRGLTFIYELETPTTESADSFTNPQIVDDFGTEEYVIDSDIAVPIPVGHNTKYTPNLRAKLEMLPNSPDSDGDYIVRHTSGESAFVLLEKELPSVPSEDGTYVLKCTVSSGTATLTWESEE